MLFAWISLIGCVLCVIPNDGNAVFPDNLEVLGVLGQGKFGIAQKIELPDHTVAVMKTAKPGEKHEEWKAKLLEELGILSNLQNTTGTHANVVQLLGKNKNGIILQFYENKSLKDLFKRISANQESISLLQKKKIMKGVADGLQFLHDNNVLHCDVTPENTFLTKVDESYIPAIGDFGEAVKCSSGDDKVCLLRRRGQYMYMAPESYTECVGVVGKSDTYNLGIMAHEFFSLESRFEEQVRTKKDPQLWSEVVAQAKHKSFTKEQEEAFVIRERFQPNVLPIEEEYLKYEPHKALRGCIEFDPRARTHIRDAVKILGASTDDAYAAEGDRVFEESRAIKEGLAEKEQEEAAVLRLEEEAFEQTLVWKEKEVERVKGEEKIQEENRIKEETGTLEENRVARDRRVENYRAQEKGFEAQVEAKEKEIVLAEESTESKPKMDELKRQMDELKHKLEIASAKLHQILDVQRAAEMKRQRDEAERIRKEKIQQKQDKKKAKKALKKNEKVVLAEQPEAPAI